jgi:MFS transporter, ACS family, tartrate transporter
MSLPQTDSELSLGEQDNALLMRKVTRRLIPFLFVLYIIAYLDRTNAGFAMLTMGPDLHLKDDVIGLGQGIFFIGYFFFEVPSNLILQRVGARRWIARIMFTWGALAMSMVFIRDAASFCGLRLLLGMAEAGFFPGMILYLTYWYTRSERGRIIAMFMTATALANMFGAPISGALLSISALGLKSWQWLFLLEGLPAVVLGFVVLAYLPNGPHDATWLATDEREAIQQRLLTDRQHHPLKHTKFSDAVANPYVWLLGLLYFLLVMPQYGVTFWLPKYVKEFSGLPNWLVGWVTAIPFLFAAISMVLVGTHSDRTGERRLHVAIPAAVGGLGLLAGAFLHTPWLIVVGMTVGAAAMWSTLGPFWTLPTAILGGEAAAGGIALINSVGNLGGFAGPYAVGWIKIFVETHKIHTGSSFTYPLVALAISIFLAAALALFARRD